MQEPKVLIVDDDIELVTLVSSWLRLEGMKVCSASDGATCLMQARKQQPDLIVLDLGLPAGDGMVALARLKQNMHTSHIPVIVLSAKSAGSAAEAALEAGAQVYIEKTGSKSDFVHTVHEVLENPVTSESFG